MSVAVNTFNTTTMQTITKDFTKMSQNGDYKAVGYAIKIPCGDDDFELDLECEIELTDEQRNTIMNFVFNYTNCNHCGSRMKNVVIVQDVNTQSIHVVGSKCGEGIEQFGFSANRLQGQTIRNAKILKGRRQMKSVLDANEGLKEALESKHKIIRQINENFKIYKTLSQKQVDLVFKLAKQQEKFDLQNKPIDFTELKDEKLTVVSLKEVENRFGYGKTTKVLLKSEKGWKLYGNLPSIFNEMCVKIERNMIVSFTCKSITVSNDDKSFGFFQRAKIKWD